MPGVHEIELALKAKAPLSGLNLRDDEPLVSSPKVVRERKAIDCEHTGCIAAQVVFGAFVLRHENKRFRHKRMGKAMSDEFVDRWSYSDPRPSDTCEDAGLC